MGIAIGIEIDIHIETGHAGCHQLAIGRIDIPTAGIDQAVRTFLALGHLQPGIPFNESRVESPRQNGDCHPSEQKHDEKVTE